MSAILPGATIGILGGGQLGRMTAMAARSLGYRIQHLSRVIADFRLHPQSKTCTMGTVQSLEKRRIMWSVSSIPNRFQSSALRRAAFLSLQTIASLMRWSEKMLRGYYFIQHRPS